MKAIKDVIKFLEDYVIECDPEDGCGRCNEAREHVKNLKELTEAMPTQTESETMLEELKNRLKDEEHRFGFVTGWDYCDEWFRNRMKSMR